MNPERARAVTGMTNHLLAKTMSQHLSELNAEQISRHLLWPPMVIEMDPGQAYHANEDDEDLARLDILFRAIFSGLDRETYLQYREVYYGYNDFRVKYQSRSQKSVILYSPFFEPTLINSGNFFLRISPLAAGHLLSERWLKLMALIDLEVRKRLAFSFGGMEAYRFEYPKIQVVSEIHSAIVMFEVAKVMSVDFLRTLRVHFGHEKSIEALELALLESMVDKNRPEPWLHARLSHILNHFPDDHAGIMKLVTKVLLDIPSTGPDQVWTELKDLTEMSKRNSQLIDWFKALDLEQQHRIQILSGQNKDTELMSAVMTVSTVKSLCQGFLKPPKPFNN